MTKHFKTLKEWLQWQEGFHPQVIDLGLERVATVFKTLVPKGVIVPVITVAGTNGKGSCIALLEAIYCAQGYRVGAYTSPHILKYNERIRIDGQPVADLPIVEAFARIEACRYGVSLSYFEFSTLAALDIFSRADLDVILLEVGLGGRLDAVNIIDPDVAIISSIDIDHAEWLGNTREQIGSEKAGIFRPFKPAIVGDPNPPASLAAIASEKNTPLLCLGQQFTFECHANSWNWQLADLHYQCLPFPALKGRHQFYNAAAVLAGIYQLQTLLPVSEQAVRTGLIDVKLKGRFQFLPSAIPVLLDVGHNPQAVRTLFDYVSVTFPQKRIHAVFAMMKDKDIRGVIETMAPLIYDWTLAPLQNPRAATSAMMLDIFAQCGIEKVSGNFEHFKYAIRHAEELAKTEDLILVFGSFFLVSAYLTEFGNDEISMLETNQASKLEKLSVEELKVKSVPEACAVEIPCQ